MVSTHRFVIFRCYPVLAPDVKVYRSSVFSRQQRCNQRWIASPDERKHEQRVVTAFEGTVQTAVYDSRRRRIQKPLKTSAL